jgi:hypothetical protein
MDHTQLKIIPHLLRPARGGAAGVVIVFALLLSIAAKAGLFGLPLALILTSWFFKYAYILFDHTVRGFDESTPLCISRKRRWVPPRDGSSRWRLHCSCPPP